MGKLIKGTHHICLKPQNKEEFDKTISFYRDVLDMEPVRAWDGRMMLAIGDGSVMEIVTDGVGESGRGSIQHFALRTDSVDECCKVVEEAGYEVFLKPFDVTLGEGDNAYPIRVAFCYGPMGEEIEFFQEY